MLNGLRGQLSHGSWSFYFWSRARPENTQPSPAFFVPTAARFPPKRRGAPVLMTLPLFDRGPASKYLIRS